MAPGFTVVNVRCQSNWYVFVVFPFMDYFNVPAISTAALCAVYLLYSSLPLLYSFTNHLLIFLNLILSTSVISHFVSD